LTLLVTVGQDFASGQNLSAEQRWTRGLGGLANLALFGAGALEGFIGSTAATGSGLVRQEAGMIAEYALVGAGAKAKVGAQLAVTMDSAITRSLRGFGTKEASATAAAIKRGMIEVELVDSLPGDFAGLQLFGTNKLQVLKSLPAEEAAAIVAHEFKHYLDHISPQNYNIWHELEAYRFQAAATGRAFDEQATLARLMTHPVYGKLPR
jgi:hypothetical protein